MNTYAVIASNHSHSYQPFAPITALFWREVVGFKTICFLTGTKEEWDEPAASLVRRKLDEAGALIHHIGKLEGYQDAQAAQSSRQHAAALDLPLDDVLLTGDIDMWSLDRDWFRQHDPAKWDFTSWYANAYGPLAPTPPFHPTPYIAATVAKWREVMQLECRGEILTQMQANFDRTLTPHASTWTSWWHDELYFNSKLKAWSGYPHRVQMISREGQPPHDRIDRCAWPAWRGHEYAFDWTKKYVDTHLIRPGVTTENWPRIRPLVERYIPKHLAWVDEYVKLYQKEKYNV